MRHDVINDNRMGGGEASALDISLTTCRVSQDLADTACRLHFQ